MLVHCNEKFNVDHPQVGNLGRRGGGMVKEAFEGGAQVVL